MLRGEVWSVELPFAGGREQAGRRPAVVVQDEVYGQGSPLVLAVPLTTQVAAERFPATVKLQPSAENDLTSSSIAMVFQLRALDRTRFVQRLGALSGLELQQVLEELRKLAGL